MTRVLLCRVWLLLALVLPAAWAERVADLPIPTRYVNDYAHILSNGGAARVEALSQAVHKQANAELVLVTISKLEDGQSVEEFTVALEEKWKLGKAGEDRSALYVIVMDPRKLRIETGYGLEGILNDAKVGAILDVAVPSARQGDYDGAAYAGIDGMAEVIAADAHVTLDVAQPAYAGQRQARAPQKFGLRQILFGIFTLFVFISMVRRGNAGWAFFLLQTFLGGGGGFRGGRGGDDDSWGSGGGGGGGFGGVGGGGSGGGGASRDF